MTEANKKTAMIQAEGAIRDEVAKKGIQFAELSPLMRELLGMVYIRGGLEALHKIRDDQNKSIQ